MKRRERLREFDTMLPAHDARIGHGYGRVGAPRGSGQEWKSSDVYPYIEGPDEDLEDEDIELSLQNVDKLMSKLDTTFYNGHDPYGRRRARVDRGSFAHSSMRGLGEVAKGMVPFPDMYKSRGTAVGGMSPQIYKTGPGKKGGAGSKKGYASPPPPFHGDTGEEAYCGTEIMTSDERALARAKKDHEELTKEFDDIVEDFRQES